MRKLLLALVILFTQSLSARSFYHDYVERGGQTALSSLTGTTLKVQGSYPFAQVTVYVCGTSTLATIYSDSAGTVIPGSVVTANSVGYFSFWHDLSCIKRTATGGGLPSAQTIDNIQVGATTAANVFDASGPPYSMVCDGSTSIVTAWNAVVAAAGTTGGTIIMPSGVCAHTTKLIIPSSARPLIFRGPAVAISLSVAPQTTLRATASMTQQLEILGNYHRFENVAFDSNRLTTYGVYLDGASHIDFWWCRIKNALKDGIFTAAISLNQGMLLHGSSIDSNGTLYVTSGIAAQYVNGWRTTITGTAATTASNNTITITGSSTDLTTLGLRFGDPVRVGGTKATAFYGMISSVTASTITLMNTTANLPTLSASGLDFAIGSGDGIHEVRSASGGLHHITSRSYLRANAGFGIHMDSVYGSTLDGINLVDFNNFAGIALGQQDNASVVNEPVMSHVYMEENTIDYWIGSATSAKIIAPTENASIFMVGALSNLGCPGIGTIDRNGVVESICSGVEQDLCLTVRNNGGTREHKITSDCIIGSGGSIATRINGESNTFTTTALINGGVGFSTGVGIASADNSYLMFDTPNAQGDIIRGSAMIEYNSTGTAVTVSPSVLNLDVNGTTLKRPILKLFNSADGTAVQWTTAAIPSGKEIRIRVRQYMR